MNQCLRIALVPAYCPDKKLISLTKQLSEKGFSVVVVNDGSSPSYAAVFQNASQYATILSHCSNRGKGAAIKTGLGYIRKHFLPPYVVVTCDADGQHLVKDIITVTNQAVACRNVLVVGSRKMDISTPFRSLFGNMMTRVIFRMRTHCHIHDTQSGLRAFSDSLVKTLMAIRGDRYEYEINVLLLFARQKRKILELPVHTVYLEKNNSSHFRFMKDSFRIYREIFRH